jgi:23S rRNA pseudouridine1911/1915/1917 synthase
VSKLLSKIKIIYQDSDVIVVNKPAGLKVHPCKARPLGKKALETPEPTLIDWLVERYPEVGGIGDLPEIRPGLVHRLDQGTSGVMIIARNQKSFSFLKSLFKKRKVIKTYLALVVGTPKKSASPVKSQIGKSRSKGIRQTVFQKTAKDFKGAFTEFKVLKSFDKFSLLKVYPRTGRTHQIRVHLASIGHPIVGDSLYGNWKNQPQIAELGRLFLHALALELTLPYNREARSSNHAQRGKRIQFEAGLPQELNQIIKKLEANKLTTSQEAI